MGSSLAVFVLVRQFQHAFPADQRVIVADHQSKDVTPPDVGEKAPAEKGIEATSSEIDGGRSTVRMPGTRTLTGRITV